MGATFSRVKNWIVEILTYQDLNEEIDNILENMTPEGVDDYSTNVTQMRLNTDPGEVGTESLATSTAGELERLRFAIKEIKGNVPQWYTTSTTSLSDIASVLSSSLVANRIVSGASSTLSSAPRFLVPSGSTTTLTIDGSPTPLVYSIAGVSYSITSDLTISGLSTAPASANTCTVNDTILAAQELSKWAGEDSSTLTVSAMGVNISNLTGSYGAFKVVHAGNTEFFIGYVNSSTQITNCLRGCFLNSTLSKVDRIAISNGDTITLLKLTWIFANTLGTTAVSYVNPVISYVQPTDTTVYWLDLSTNLWKTFNGSAWVSAGVTLIGICAQDTTSCIAARAGEFSASSDSYSSLQVEYKSATTVQQQDTGGKIGVGAYLIDYGITRPTWDIVLHLESGYVEAASTTYFIYISELGRLVLSPTKPYNAAGSGRGWYHPHEKWRAVGHIFNNASSDFDQGSSVTYTAGYNNTSNSPMYRIVAKTANLGLTTSVAANALTVTLVAGDGNALSASNPGYFKVRSSSNTSGVSVVRKLTESITITAPSGSSLGHTAAVAQYVWAYLLDDAGVIDLALSGITIFRDESTASATQISAGSTSGSTLYSALSHVGAKPTLLIGRLAVNEATAGVWASAPTEVSMNPVPVLTAEDWSSTRVFTPVNFGTVTNTQYFTRRIGDSLEVVGYFKTGNPTANPASITLPITMDSGKLMATKRYAAGHWYASGVVGTPYNSVDHAGIVFVDAAVNFTTLFFTSSGVTAEAQTINANNASFGGVANWGIHFRVTLPVSGWSLYGP